MCLLAAVAGTLLAAGPARGQAAWGDFLPAEVMGARTFVRQHPQWDGRGLVIAVLDTGVDVRAQGLQQTAAGLPKVIEARDFSGQGDVRLEVAATQGSGDELSLLVAGNRTKRTKGLAPSVDGNWWVGTFHETAIGPESLQDINHDGKLDTELSVVVWRTGQGPDDVRAVIDWDGDGDLAEEPSVRPFHVAREVLQAPAVDPKADVVQLSFAFEPDWSRPAAQLHFTDGSHGTHVAGIAAGYQMFGKPGWDGVAPGSQVMSLKIGHNARAGGATTTGAFAKALRFAGQWSRAHGLPVVVNASYGVGAGTERQSDMDREVDSIVAEFPLLTIAFSAGNSGPGLSSVGTPAAADLALAIGAVLPKDAAPALYGGRLAQHELFAFSSRGGELAKPEVVAPGAASAAVPVWDGHEIKQGTSMAAPHAAGAMALVWSALLAEAAGRPLAELGWHGGLVRRALVGSAQPLAGMTPLDQGAGMIDVAGAAKLAVSLTKSPEAVAVLGWHQGSMAPRPDGAPMPATFLRAGWPSDAPAVVLVNVRAILAQAWSAQRKADWSLALDLQAEGDWLSVQRPRIQVRSDNPTMFELRIDPKKLERPGLYTAAIVAREVGSKDGHVVFRHSVAVVVPQTVGAADRYRKSWPAASLPAGKVFRQWIAVPPGASRAAVTVKRVPGKFSQVALAMFAPGGQRQRPERRWASSADATDAEWSAAGDALTPGVWELTAAAWVVPGDSSTVDIDVQFSMVAQPAALDLSPAGGRFRGTAAVTQTAQHIVQGTLRGKLEAWSRKKEVKTDTDVATHSVILGPTMDEAELRLSVDTKTWDACTDIAIMVRDGQGKVVAEGAFGDASTELKWSKAGSGEQKYTVEVAAGFARERKAPWTVTIAERLKLSSPIVLKVVGPDTTASKLYPYQATTWTATADTIPKGPDGYRLTGTVELVGEDGRTVLHALPARSEP